MFIFIGIAVVIAGVMGGFMLHGGPPAVLLQWSEFLIMGEPRQDPCLLARRSPFSSA